jgi:heme/copper-type cytochrome/quinol oxidase subunit 4
MSEITHEAAHEERAATIFEKDPHALHSDRVKIGDREITLPGGLYTLVFIVLAVVTLVEVVLAESPLPPQISYPLLAALSVAKAVLVVLYYMHLLQDSRIFAWAFGIPLGMASLIVVFVMFLQPNLSY